MNMVMYENNCAYQATSKSTHHTKINRPHFRNTVKSLYQKINYLLTFSFSNCTSSKHLRWIAYHKLLQKRKIFRTRFVDNVDIQTNRRAYTGVTSGEHRWKLNVYRVYLILVQNANERCGRQGRTRADSMGHACYGIPRIGRIWLTAVRYVADRWQGILF